MSRTVADPGSVSHGTMRSEDLIPCFVGVLDALREERSLSTDGNADRHGKEDDQLGSIERRQQEEGYYDSEEATWDLEWLFDQLEEYSPDGHRFGAHEGDGSDYGYWPCEEG